LRDQYPDLDVFGAIEVGDNVFIGHGATILPGTSIGDNCVIGARSLVKGVVDSDSVYAGVPARKIRTLAEYSARMREASLDTKRMPASRKKALLQDHFSATGGEVGRQV
jgi:carbonic anhydrase/acetyltransferase-like protein (isoleucine patch superfamily)